MTDAPPKPRLTRDERGWRLDWKFAHHDQSAFYTTSEWPEALARANWLAYHQGRRVRSQLKKFIDEGDRLAVLQQRAWARVFENMGRTSGRH